MTRETTAAIAMHAMGLTGAVYVWASRDAPKWARVTTAVCTLTTVALDAYLFGSWLHTRAGQAQDAPDAQ